MEIVLYDAFKKRTNSTKIPGSGGVRKQVRLKEGCSIDSPRFELSEPVHEYTYCEAFGHRYFIDDVVNIDGHRSELHCSMDVLGTFRGDIFQYNAFVERADSDYNPMINDNLLSSEQDVVSKSYANTSIALDQQGTYVIPVTCKNGVRLYAFPYLAMAAAFYDGTLYEDASGNVMDISFWDQLFVTVGLGAFNATDYMGTMIWLPISYAAWTEATGGIYVGMWTLDYTGYNVLAATEMNITGALNLPANIYSDFRGHSSAYSKYSLYLPGIGEVPLNAMDAAEDDLYYDMALDFFTGAVSYKIYHTNGTHVATFNGQLGVPVPIGKTGLNIGGFVSNTIGAIAGVVGAAATGGAGAAVAAGITGTVSTANTLLDAQTSISGGAGNKAVIQENNYIVASCENYGSADFPQGVAGRPLYEWRSLGSLSGYVKCGGASIELNAHAGERAAVNGYLNSGFYVE